MKENLTILEIEEKTTQKGKPYARIKTDTRGWMACFDSVASDHCKQNVGQNVSVEVKESGEYCNIAKFYGVEDDNVVTVKMRDGVPAIRPQTVEEAIAAVPRPEKPFVRTMPKDPVGLAVEVYGIISNNLSKEPREGMRAPTTDEVMKIAIDVVKQAQEAFS